MAKKAVAVPVKTRNVPVKTTAGGPPAVLAARMRKDAGKGVSTDQSDNLVPLIYILQPLSPQVDKRNAAFIEDAEPGAIWLRNHSQPIVGGEDGIEVQPCYFSKDLVEWRPREAGGGMMGRFPVNEPPGDAKTVEDPKNPQHTKLVRKNGNELIETRYHVCRIKTRDGWVPYVIPFKSTGHTVSRQWMFMMNSKQVDGEKAPSFAGRYRLTTKQRTNAAGTWFVFDIQDLGWVETEQDYEEGKKLFDAFSSGAKVIDVEDDVDGDDDKGAM